MNSRRSPLLKRGMVSAAVGGVALAALTVGAAHANPSPSNDLGFAPITTAALPCTANGLIEFANDANNHPVTPTQLMQAGDPATPVNAPPSSNAVGRVNDMIALSPDNKYLFTPSENSIPTENGIGTDGSDGITRLTLSGKDSGKAEILADNVDGAGTNLWQRVDGIKWYPHGANQGVLLASEEVGASAVGGVNGHIWQVDPITGEFHRLDWLGGYAHEGVGLDAAGNLYLGAEERDRGAIFKAVPNDVNDLTAGGALYYMVGTGTNASGWKGVTDPANAAFEAAANGAILFDRPEDFDEANGRVYFAVTEPSGDALLHTGSNGQVVNKGGVYNLTTVGVPNLASQSGALPYFRLQPMIQLNDPTYANQSDARNQQGLQFPDNLAFDGRGHLWVHEDIPDNNGAFPVSGIDVSKQARNQQDELYVYVLNAAGDQIISNPSTAGPGVSGGYKAADMRTSPGAAGHPCENEFTGGIFGRDGKTLYINQQHWDNPTLTSKVG